MKNKISIGLLLLITFNYLQAFTEKVINIKFKNLPEPTKTYLENNYPERKKSKYFKIIKNNELIYQVKLIDIASEKMFLFYENGKLIE